MVTDFWRIKSLQEMTKEEWESLCDGCGLCCLHKLQDFDTGEVAYTNVACRLLDVETLRCRNYENRKTMIPDCVVLSQDQLDQFHWLPDSCAYRLVNEGQDIPDWHPLKTGDPETVHQAPISGKGKIISEREAGDLEEHIIDWVDFQQTKPKDRG